MTCAQSRRRDHTLPGRSLCRRVCRGDLVRLQRDALQRAVGPQLIAAVERPTRRTVRTFLSGTDEDAVSAVEAFVLESEPPEAAPLKAD